MAIQPVGRQNFSTASPGATQGPLTPDSSGLGGSKFGAGLPPGGGASLMQGAFGPAPGGAQAPGAQGAGGGDDINKTVQQILQLLMQIMQMIQGGGGGGKCDDKGGHHKHHHHGHHGGMDAGGGGGGMGPSGGAQDSTSSMQDPGAEPGSQQATPTDGGTGA